MFPILIGSSGAYNGVIGDWYIVNESVQGDRGRLNQDNVYFPKKDKMKKSRKEYRLEANVFEDILKVIFGGKKAVCYSSNFLNECDYIGVGKNETALYDMETYYFYAYCDILSVNNYLCIRFVTDVVCRKGEESDNFTELWEYFKENEKKFELEIKDRERLFPELRKYKRNTFKYEFEKLFELVEIMNRKSEIAEVNERFSNRFIDNNLAEKSERINIIRENIFACTEPKKKK